MGNCIRVNRSKPVTIYTQAERIETLEAENAELKEAIFEACAHLKNDTYDRSVKAALSILSTGESMYIDEYDGAPD